MKNIKFYKKIGIVAGGVLLANTASYCICVQGLHIKPFSQNEIYAHKLIAEQYDKDGIYETNKYIVKNNSEDQVIIKTPFDVSNNGGIRSVYSVPASNFTSDENEYIVDNINNQTELLNKSYVQEAIENNDLKFEYIELTSKIPEENSYEIGYIKYIEDFNDKKVVTDSNFDAFATSYYLTIGALTFFIESTIYNSLKKASEETSEVKHKKLTKK